MNSASPPDLRQIFLSGFAPKRLTPTSAVEGEQALKILEGRWKLVILFHLFGGYCGSPILSGRSRPAFHSP